MSNRNIKVYSREELVGTLEIPDNFNNALISVFDINTLNLNLFKVLYVEGMDYGIVVPEDIARRIEYEVNKE